MKTNLRTIDIASICHEANRALCKACGDHSQSPWITASQWQKDSACAGVHAVVSDPNITPEQLHEKWSEAKLADGWVYGEVKDAEAKTHPCLVPYSELPAHQRAKDGLFRAVVLALI